MIGPFRGPDLKEIGHARLLYLPRQVPQGSHNPQYLWSHWPNELAIIDNFITSQPHINVATDKIYLYFFNSDKSMGWVGREIIGHKSRYPDGLESFDSFAGELFEWRLAEGEGLQLKGKDIVQVEEQLRSLAPEALAPTWRIEISGMEPWMHSENYGDVAFQFYKLL